jgi:hypothetical protein
MRHRMAGWKGSHQPKTVLSLIVERAKMEEECHESLAGHKLSLGNSLGVLAFRGFEASKSGSPPRLRTAIPRHPLSYWSDHEIHR